MAKGVFTVKPVSKYDDDPWSHYQFPSMYLRAARACIGDFVVFYEPSKIDAERKRAGGRQVYFGTAQVADVVQDPDIPDWWRAVIVPGSYVEFDNPVPLMGPGGYFERRMASRRGGPSRGLLGVSLRAIEDDVYEAIVSAGFARALIEEPPDFRTDRGEVQVFALADEPATFERPIVERIYSRPVRERAFALRVQTAYDKRCAVTGLALVNGGGRAEIEAAHIRPVEDKGPDSIRNGLALSRTFHWLFDRGLIGFDDDYRIRVARDHVDPRLATLIRPEGALALPKDQAAWPHPQFLRFHREKFAEKARLWT